MKAARKSRRLLKSRENPKKTATWICSPIDSLSQWNG
jgi:hypothetical protein